MKYPKYILWKQDLRFNSITDFELTVKRLKSSEKVKINNKNFIVATDDTQFNESIIHFTMRTVESRFKGWAYGEIEKHNGGISVRSTIGVGATYILLALLGFPLALIFTGFFSFPPQPIELVLFFGIELPLILAFRMYAELVKDNVSEAVKHLLMDTKS